MPKYQLAALEKGDDFLQKPISEQHLVEAISSRAERSRILRNMMYRDGLTGGVKPQRAKQPTG